MSHPALSWVVYLKDCIIHYMYEEIADKQNIQMPGLVNLLGDRYVKLRSNTIEQHLHNSISTNDT